MFAVLWVISAQADSTFLIAAFCRIAKLLSHSEQMGLLVGAGIEPLPLRNDQMHHGTKRRYRQNAKTQADGKRTRTD